MSLTEFYMNFSLYLCATTKKYSFYKPVLGMHPHKNQKCIVYICTPGREPPNLFGFGRTPSHELGDWLHQYLDKYKSIAFTQNFISLLSKLIPVHIYVRLALFQGSG